MTPARTPWGTNSWDYAVLQEKSSLGSADVEAVIGRVVESQAPYYERLWQQLSGGQRGALQALALGGPDELLSQAVRQRFRMGPASSVQKALQALMARDLIDRYLGRYFFLDPLQALWVRGQMR